MSHRLNEVHGRIQARQRQKARGGRHWMREAKKAYEVADKTPGADMPPTGSSFQQEKICTCGHTERDHYSITCRSRRVCLYGECPCKDFTEKATKGKEAA